jgi:hypothetical protein
MDYSKANIPEFKCHKKVKAFRIIQIEELNPLSGATIMKDCAGHSATVTKDYLEKHKPQIGGYYVLYKDGYESFSPAEVFEDRLDKAKALVTGIENV